MMDVAEFHQAAEIPFAEHPDLTLVPHERRMLRIDLITEEFRELMAAERDNDIVEIADALGDMMVIIAGTALEYGIDLNAVLQEINRSNLAKIVDGVVKRRTDGKILKPDGWEKPNIKKALGLETIQ